MNEVKRKLFWPYSKSKLELNSKKVELEWCKKILSAFLPFFCTESQTSVIQIWWPYSKSKLELESNLSEVLPVNCTFICGSTVNYLQKLKLEYLKSGFKWKKKDNNTDEKFFESLKFDFLRVQLKFAFRIRP